MPPPELWRYEKLTWPEINDAIEASKPVVVPIGSTEQHGPHLPLDVDVVCPVGVAEAAARLVPDKVLVMPPFVHGYTAHVMDFPGTVNVHWETFINCIVDVGKSLAYHGSKKIILLNGHGSNAPNLDLAARRVNLETDAECCFANWWDLLNVDKAFMEGWRESKFPGGCAHACELETSVYLHLDEENVRKEKIADGDIAFHRYQSDFQWMDLKSLGPAQVTSWTASYSDSGVLGQATLASKEKGRLAVDEAGKQLARWIEEFGQRPKPPRGDHHAQTPSMPMPWNQQGPPANSGNVHNSTGV